MLRRITRSAVILTIVAGCHRIPATSPPATSLLYLPEPLLDDAGLISIDTASLRPSIVSAGNGNPLVTNFQNGRYHGETIRAISEDSTVRANTARQIVLQSGAGGPLILDFQGVAPDQLRSFTELLRDISALAHARSRNPVALVVPAHDTLSFPSGIMSRVVDVVIVRAYGEHRPGTLPGAPTTDEFIMRALGERTVVLGPGRVIAALPLFGYRWDKNGNARVITYAQASGDLNSEASAFRRDPATQYLIAHGRDGWSAWVPDGRTIEYLISIARRSGVSAIALAGVKGAAPDIADRAAQAIRR